MATTNTETPQPTEEPYVMLCLDLHHVEAASEARMTAQWQGHFGSDWRAVERFMEKRFPRQWGAPAKAVELSGPGGGPVPVAAGVLSLDEAEALVARVEARAIDAASEEVPRELVPGGEAP